MSRRPRKDVWFQWFYYDDQVKCPVCEKNIMIKDKADTWQREHIIKLSLGGPDILTNLIPICKKCNLTMKKRCRCTFDHMVDIGKITLKQAELLTQKQIHINKNFDPVCNQIQKNGKRCWKLKKGKDELYCQRHIMAKLVPMDID